MVEHMITAKNRLRNRSGSSMLAKNFLKRLDQGVVIDRTQKCTDSKSRKKIVAPDGLRKFMKR